MLLRNFLRLGIRTRLLSASLIGLFGLLALGAVAADSIRRQMIDDRITMVRNLTELAHTVIARQYARQTAGEIDEATAKRNAIESLRTMRWANGEYFFIDDFDAHSVLLPIRPEFEGKDVSDLADSSGTRFVLAQRDLALNGGGVIRYEFTKPGVGTAAEKLSHVRPFDPWRWFVATGIYLDDVDREVRTVLLQTMGFGAIVALVTWLLSRAVARSIGRPLGRLTEAIDRLTRRDFDFDIPERDRRDEIGDIARAIDLLRTTRRDFEALQEASRLERETALAFQRESAARFEKTARLVSMGEMATSLAHELNQPLAAVANYCNGSVRRLEAGSDDRAGLLAAMRKAAGEAARASRIVARLRRFLRRSDPSLEPQRLSEILDEAASMAAGDLRRRGHSIVIDAPDDLPAVRADRVLIGQVLFNLLRNGIEAMEGRDPERRRLVMAARAEAGQVEVTVTDFGTGIGDGDRDRIFQPFYTSKPEGLGVGLNICRSIVEFHGGRLWASDNPEGGAVFHFTLSIA
ncbi:MAG: cache domain-containing protein [Hyphomicrobiales bacterium]|nr:cache domain-containing protein [Hyphomicrobiales bacterium]